MEKDKTSERVSYHRNDSVVSSNNVRVSTSSNVDEWNGSMVEPELEFDDIGVELAAKDAETEADEGIAHNDHYLPHIPELSKSFSKRPGQELEKEERDNMAAYRGGAMTPEGLIDDDFAEELGVAATEEAVYDPERDFRDIAKYGIIQLAGDDSFGRKVIVFSACRLPPTTEMDPERLLKYLKHTLDQYVENDYTLVYFHHGLTSRNKPGFKWLRQAYGEFDRKYKKNLKALYLVHPTAFIRLIWTIFKPVISVKFGRKIMYVNYLHELAQHLQLDQLIIPQRVKEYDALLLAKYKPMPVPTSVVHAPARTQQFGVELNFIKEHSNDIIPPVMQQTVSYIKENGLDVEGIFRRSANANKLKMVQSEFNRGMVVNFKEHKDIHIPAAILKSFLRQLPEPLLTFDQYDHLVHVQSFEFLERMEEMRRILHDEIPEENYCVLKYLIHFLTEVVAHSEENKMNSQNLAIVFGPNLMWSKSNASLASMGHVNSCTLFLIENYEQLFDK